MKSKILYLLTVLFIFSLTGCSSAGKKTLSMAYNAPAKRVIETGLPVLEEYQFNRKFWEKDPSLWSADAKTQESIRDSLGWQSVYDWTLERVDEITAFANAAKQDFDHCVVMGMGGSSLAPDVFRQVFGKQEGYPELMILDTTNPDSIAAVRAQINPARTLFIFASKSGGTQEPASQFAYFYREVEQSGVVRAGKNFVAITDEGTPLAKLGEEKHFRKVFINRSDIGGRFSALSYFGMVPAAVMGVDVKQVLALAQAEAKKMGVSAPVDKNIGLNLGVYMGTEVTAFNRSKMTLLLPEKISALGAWLEQLLSESAGKNGTGIVPVIETVADSGFVYPKDHFFVRMDYLGADNVLLEQEENRLGAQGFDTFTISMARPEQIGALFLVWEIATVASCAQLHLNPFDNPDSSLSKKFTKQILAQKKPVLPSLRISRALQPGLPKDSFVGKNLYPVLQEGDYVAILSYLNPTAEVKNQLNVLRQKIRQKTGHPVMLEYGPRYLHSMNQLYKGGENRGVFLVLVSNPLQDVPVPQEAYTFKQLMHAQALGDFQALDEKARRAVWIYWEDNSLPEETRLKELIDTF